MNFKEGDLVYTDRWGPVVVVSIISTSGGAPTYQIMAYKGGRFHFFLGTESNILGKAYIHPRLLEGRRFLFPNQAEEETDPAVVREDA